MQDKMLSKLEDIYRRYCGLSEKLADSAVISDTAEWAKTAKEQAELSEVAQKYEEYQTAQTRLSQAQEAVKTEADAEMRELLETEISDCTQMLASLADFLYCKDRLCGKLPSF